MRKSGLIVGMIMVVLIAASVSRSESPTTARDSLQEENARLRAENEMLKARVSDLEKQLARQRVTIRTLPPTTQPFDWKMDPGILPPNFRYRLEPRSVVPRGNATRPAQPGMPNTVRPFTFVAPDENSVPRDWVRQEFNGQPFYLIPLSAQATRQ